MHNAFCSIPHGNTIFYVFMDVKCHLMPAWPFMDAQMGPWDGLRVKPCLHPYVFPARDPQEGKKQMHSSFLD